MGRSPAATTRKRRPRAAMGIHASWGTRERRTRRRMGQSPAATTRRRRPRAAMGIHASWGG
uniref:Uncharacterized protein n=1 Tax=Arundo donax TaxID=35708 RepID=A0A0A9G0F0_ARUDO